MFRRYLRIALCTYVALTTASVATVGPSLLERTPLLPGAWPADAAKFSFAVIGDKTGGGPEGWPYFDAAVDHVNLIRPDFAVMTGDMVPGYTSDSTRIVAEWEEFLTHARRLEVPLFVIPGNHDFTSAALIAEWRRRMGRTYYSVDWKGAHFLMLNSEEERDGAQDFGAEQMAFIREDLAAHADATHTFLFLHRPAWRTDDTDMCYEQDWPRIIEMLGDRPYTVFAGHWHHLIHDRIDGHDFIVMGPTGGATRPSDYYPLGSFHHWTHVTVDGDSVHVAHIPAGQSVLPRDVAKASFLRDVRGLARVIAGPPERVSDGRLRSAYEIRMENALSETARVSLSMVPRAATLTTPWHDTTVTLAPGDAARIAGSYEWPGNDGMPMIRYSLQYDGRDLYRHRLPIPFAPDSTLRAPARWSVTTPARVSGSPPDWSSVPRGRGTRTITPDVAGMVWVNRILGMADSTAAFATTRVYSPRALDTWIGFEAEETARVTVNGATIGGETEFTMSSGSERWKAIHLNRGWNTIEVGIQAGDGFWGFGMHLIDPAGALRFEED